MANLTDKQINNTYKSLLKTVNNSEITGAVEISDGAGNGTGITIGNDGQIVTNGVISFGSIKDAGENITISKFVDEADGIPSNDNDTTIPTSAAVIDYVESQITLDDLDFAADTGTGAVDLDSETFDITGSNGITTTALDNTLEIDGSALQTSIATNATNISQNATDIASNDTDISALDTRVTTNESDITTNTSNISTNATNISSNSTSISANATNIATNAANISSNDTDIANLDTRVTTNEGNISTNTTNIASNDTDIAALDTRVTANEGDIATNQTNISTNASNISTNTANISTNATNIATNTANISSNDTDIATNASNISTNTSDIATNTTNIATNTSDISTNTSNISTNTSNISSNTTAIADKVSKSGDTMTGDLTMGLNSIFIGGTGAANELDDYEEGTFTPTLVVSGTNTSISSKLGRYTKIGNLVHVEILIRDFVPEDETTIIQSCTNLPFTIKDNTFTSYAIGQLWNNRNSNTGRGFVYGTDNTTSITFYDNGLYTTLPGDETTTVTVNITYTT